MDEKSQVSEVRLGYFGLESSRTRYAENSLRGKLILKIFHYDEALVI